MKMKKITIIFLMMQFIINSLPIHANEISETNKVDETVSALENTNTKIVSGYAAYSATEELAPYNFTRRKLGTHDVGIDISYCGICHSDLHSVKGEWGEMTFPLVPGHEIVGIVSAVGDEVTNYEVGDKVGVGCLVDSCQNCNECDMGQEQFCDNKISTYGSVDKDTGRITQGGYSNYIVVKENFVVKIPENLELEKAAPLLCAGITTYSPMYMWGISSDSTVGIIGIGGLGHIAIKMAKAFGAKVIAFTHSAYKAEDIKRLGADEVIITLDDEDLTQYKNSFDLILDTVSKPHDFNAYLNCLKHDTNLVFLGIPEKQLKFDLKPLIMKRRGISGSIIGGIEETQEMLDFCSANNITADIELISADQINDAYKRMRQSDVKYRFVIDASTFEEESNIKNKDL